MIVPVDHRRREPSALQSADAFFGEMSIQRRPAAETKFTELKQLLTDRRIVGGLGFERFAKGDGYRVRDALGKFCEKSAALK